MESAIRQRGIVSGKGRCQKLYHCGCGGLSEGELCQLGNLDEEWRCEKCAKEFEEDLKKIEEAGSDRRADEMVSEDRQKFSEGESDGPERTVESKKGGAERKAAREQAVRDIVENFRSQRGVFTWEEVEVAIKERYREARSEREVTDTNVSNSVRSMKEEVQRRFHR